MPLIGRSSAIPWFAATPLLVGADIFVRCNIARHNDGTPRETDGTKVIKIINYKRLY
jgi:hypothetical protein